MKIWMSLTVVLCLHYDVDHHHRHQCINEAVFICVYPLLWSLGINGQTVLCQSTHATYTFKLFYEAIRGTFKNFVTWYRWASWMSLIPLHWLVQSVSTILHDLLFGYWYWRRTGEQSVASRGAVSVWQHLLSAHMSSQALAVIWNAGVQLLRHPPYSPDLVHCQVTFTCFLNWRNSSKDANSLTTRTRTLSAR